MPVSLKTRVQRVLASLGQPGIRGTYLILRVVEPFDGFSSLKPFRQKTKRPVAFASGLFCFMAEGQGLLASILTLALRVASPLMRLRVPQRHL